MSPIGRYGSIPHVLTNKNVNNKAHCIGQQAKGDVKDLKKVCTATVATAGTAAIVTGCSTKAQSLLHGIKEIVGNVLGDITLGLNTCAEPTTLKDIIKSKNTFQKFNSLPTAAKAAIAAGVTALAIAAPIVGISNIAKDAAIEAQHEVK